MELTFYRSARSTLPENETLDWRQVIEELQGFTSIEWGTDWRSKTDYGCFTFGRVEGRRANTNVRYLDGIAADIDIGPDDTRYLSFNDACAMVRAQGVRFIAYTTASSTSAHHKYRLYVHDASQRAIQALVPRQ